MKGFSKFLKSDEHGGSLVSAASASARWGQRNLRVTRDLQTPGERLVEKRMQCSLDLVKVVLMNAVEQATVDKSANVAGTDLDRHTNKAAVAAIPMPSLTDGGGRFRHHDLLAPRTVTRLRYNRFIAVRE
jgi:hypothetical protein